MLRPVPMMFLRAVVLSRDKRAVLRGLGDLGVLHLEASVAGPDTAPIAPPDNAAERQRCEELVRRIDDILKAFDATDESIGVQSTKHRTADRKGVAQNGEYDCESLSVIEERVKKIEMSLDSLKTRIHDAETRIGAVQTVIEQLDSFKDVNLPFSELDNFSFLHFAVGAISNEGLDDLRSDVADNVVLLPLPRSDRESALVAVTSRTGRFAMESALDKAGFKRETVQVDEGKTLRDMIIRGRAEAAAATTSERELDLALKGLAASSRGQVLCCRAAVKAEIAVLEAEEKFPHTSLTTLITGWAPADDVGLLRERLLKITDGRCVVETVSPENMHGVKVPVLLRHSWLLRPFEMLVSGYGLPGYHDLEPTIFVAITYMLMFGMMFGDIGHGFVLLLCGLFAVFGGRTGKVRDAGTLISLGGVASMIFGFIYGSCFGIKAFHKYALWHDPLDGNPMGMMSMAVCTGILVISVGIVLNIVNRIRQHDWGSGIFGSFGVIGALFYWGVLGLLIKYATIEKLGLTRYVVVLVVVVPLVLWALYPPVSHALSKRCRVNNDNADAEEGEDAGFLQRFLEAAVETFETVLSYMANTISFVRIAAYAMSHAAVLMATFAVADVVGSEVGGGVPRILVIIVGNIVTIALEGLVAGVQALRLEYYEFFGKFFSAGGEAFEPFKLSGTDGK